MSSMEAVKKAVGRAKLGVPFTTRSLLHLGTRAAVDEALYRLTKSGEITRVSRGLYVRPRVSEYAGKVPPSAEAIAEVIAAEMRAKVDVNGAAAANMLGLSTQVPTQFVFLTDGPSRQVNVGKMRVVLRHVSPRKLTFAGTPAGRAVSALLYFGRSIVGPTEIAKVRRSIGEAEFKKLTSAAADLPGWLTAAFRAYEKGVAHA